MPDDIKVDSLALGLEGQALTGKRSGRIPAALWDALDAKIADADRRWSEVLKRLERRSF